MKNTVLDIYLYREKLEEIMRDEIAIMRNMLMCLQNERTAIMHKDQNMFDHVIEERISLMSSFEVVQRQFAEYVKVIADHANVTLPDDHIPNYEETIELLQKSLTYNESELINLSEQIHALLKKIYLQNDLNGHLLQEGSLVKQVDNRQLLPEKQSQLKKTQLKLLDINEKE